MAEGGSGQAKKKTEIWGLNQITLNAKAAFSFDSSQASIKCGRNKTLIRTLVLHY